MAVALIADIHANLEALKAVLADIKKNKIRNMLCIGDIVGYGANPNECCNIIRKMEIPTVQGDHDINASNLKNLKKYNTNTVKSLRWTNRKLTKENKEFLIKLPKMSMIKIKEIKFAIVHGSVINPLYGKMSLTTSDAAIMDNFKRSNTMTLVTAHTHLPMVKKIRNRLIINPGSVGQPRDSMTEASYAIMNTGRVSAKTVRVKYDIEKAAKKIITAGLPRYLAERLYTGQ